MVRARVRALPRELGRRAAGSWGRPIAILKARILAGDWAGAERDAHWTLEQGADAGAVTPIGRYAAALAHAVLGEWPDLRVHADALRATRASPQDVADALAAIASPDPIAYAEAVESVLESFESREAYLEICPPRTRCSFCKRSADAAVSRRPSSSLSCS
jgi:hypothetical protein